MNIFYHVVDLRLLTLCNVSRDTSLIIEHDDERSISLETSPVTLKISGPRHDKYTSRASTGLDKRKYRPIYKNSFCSMSPKCYI